MNNRQIGGHLSMSLNKEFKISNVNMSDEINIKINNLSTEFIFGFDSNNQNIKSDNRVLIRRLDEKLDICD